MVVIREINEKQLSLLKMKKIVSAACAPSYTEIWKTYDGMILKLYTGYADSNGSLGDECEDIYHDIATLGDLRSYEGVLNSQFALPTEILISADEVIGYKMPFICGKPLSSVISSISVKDMKNILCQIYRDIRFIHENTPFSFCDLHEDNIILNCAGQVYHIDLDGWYNGDGYGRRSRYLSFQCNNLESLSSKYRRDIRGNWIADLNSDLFCLIQITLNYLAQRDDYFLSFDDITGYIDYLSCLEISPTFVSMCKCLYSKDDNFFSEDAVLSLPDDIKAFSFQQYLNHTSQFETEESALAFLSENRIKINRIIQEIDINSTMKAPF